MKSAFVLFSLLSWFSLNGSVLGLMDIFERGAIRFQCMKHAHTCIKGCKKSFMEAYMETQTDQENKNVTNPDTYIFLFTRRNPDRAEFLHKCPGVLPKDTYFQGDKKTVIIVHGFKQDACNVLWLRKMKDEFLCRNDYNVILIDWGWGNKGEYAPAVKHAKIVGKQIAFLINGIMIQTGACSDKFHIIGHSLGAHIAGFAGKRIKKLGRITALDPAGPHFWGNGPDERLNSSDANLVDVIHSNAGNCIIAAFGYMDPLGHADFYPNGGQIQVSCILTNIGRFLEGDLIVAVLTLLPGVCFHQQSVDYFIASINPNPCDHVFIAVECDNYENSKDVKSCDGGKCAVMGLDWVDYGVKTDGRPHKYYLDTTLTCPYRADTGLKIKRNSSSGNERHGFSA